MKKIAIGSWAFLFQQERPTTDFHDLLHHLANLGYDGVELGAFLPHPTPEVFDSREKRRDLAKMVRDHGLEFAALTPDLWSHRLVSVDDARPYLAAFAKALAFAGDLGITTIRLDTVEPLKSLGASNVDGARMMERAVQAFAAAAREAADCGATIAWEFEPGFPLNRPTEIVELVQRVRGDLGNSNFGVLFDTAHAHLCAAATLPGGALQLLDLLQGKIVHFHVCDTDGTLNEHHRSRQMPLGQGALPFDQLLPALAAAAPANDWWSIDLCFWPDAWQAAADCKRIVDRWRRKLGAPARNSG